MTIRSVLFSGGGDYVDPWHPYAESLAGAADALRSGGLEVSVLDRVDDLLAALASDDPPALLVVNAGAGPDPHPDDERLVAGIRQHLAARRGLVVLHLSSGLFPASDEWEATVGARWIWGVSGHPPIGVFPVDVEHDTLAPELTVGVDDFRIHDERYSDLRLDQHGGSRVIASHELEGVRHPLVWTRESGGGRVAVDLLGHDGASFEVPEHRQLLTRVARWAGSPGSPDA